MLLVTLAIAFIKTNPKELTFKIQILPFCDSQSKAQLGEDGSIKMVSD